MNLKLGPTVFTWTVGSKINEMTCLLTWHNLSHQKIGPKKKKNYLWDGQPIFSLRPKKLINCVIFLKQSQL